MNDWWTELANNLLKPGWVFDGTLVSEWLERAGDITPCVAAGFERAISDRDWEKFEYYVLIGLDRPARSYVPFLCAVLRMHGLPINYEDIADLLAYIADPASIDCLAETLDWEPDWDEFRALAVKCVWALGAIGTPEALDHIRGVVTSKDFKLREAAISELVRREG